MLTLLRREHELASAARQQELLRQTPGPSFEESLQAEGHWPLRAAGIDVLQLNVGKLCNQTCRHCHVDAGPDRREVMSRETMRDCLDVLERTAIPTVDITGGAPELNPDFRWLVEECRRLGRHVIDRCNLTILLVAGQEDLAAFLASRGVEIIASLPCYLEENADRQRGSGVFRKSIDALLRLNALGYGKADSPLRLSLVYNPLGPSLPPAQPMLEQAYRRELLSRFGVEFHRLYTITNMPISRFLEDLREQGRLDEYMARLAAAFNPASVGGLMCRSTLSVDWQGRLSDCDFNQMLELTLSPDLPQHIRDFDPHRLSHRTIVTGPHCFGCTAGAGSSCQGAIVR